MNELLEPPQTDTATAADQWSTELDARGSPPPDHYRAILDALSALPAGRRQFVRTKSRPTDLLQRLAAAGIQIETNHLPDGSWRSVLRRIIPPPPISTTLELAGFMSGPQNQDAPKREPAN